MEPDGSKLGMSEFENALKRLKQGGSVLLIEGDVPPDVHRIACEQLMGDASVHRQRLFVTRDSGVTVRGPVGDQTVHRDHVIVHSECCRNPTDSEITEQTSVSDQTESGDSDSSSGSGGFVFGAADECDSSGDAGFDYRNGVSGSGTETACPSDSSGADTHLTVHSLPSVLAGIVHTLRSIEQDGDPMEPGELRLCIDSIPDLIESTDRELPMRLVWYSAVAIRRRRGMAHIHLPVARESETSALFEPLADAVVELRIESGIPQQRWHLIDPGITSEWTDLHD